MIKRIHRFCLSCVTDSQWDADGAKVAGWLCLAIAAIGYFCGIDKFDLFLYSGMGAITLKCTGEAINNGKSS